MTGRRLGPTGFEDDDGAANPQLLAVLAAAESATPDQEAALMALVAHARWLVPVVARPTDPATDTVETAVVKLTRPDGQRALPIFTSIDSLAAWDADARPVPVTADRAAQAAVSEGCDVLVADVGSPHTTVLRPSMVWALAQRREWLPAYRDPFVVQAVARALRAEHDEVGIAGHALEPGLAGTGALVVVLGLRPGLGPERVEALARRVGERLATDGELRARVDDLVFRVTAC